MLSGHLSDIHPGKRDVDDNACFILAASLMQQTQHHPGNSLFNMFGKNIHHTFMDLVQSFPDGFVHA